MTTIFVATPMYGGMVTQAYNLSMMRAILAFHQKGYGFHYAYRTDDSLVPSARNLLANEFLKSEATHLMWIDADVGFNPDDIITMVKADKDIICGLYPRKTIDWGKISEAVKAGVSPEELPKYGIHTVFGRLPDQEEIIDSTKPWGVPSSAYLLEASNERHEIEASNGTHEIAAGGTGFMLIKREVFEVLSDKVPTYTQTAWAQDKERIKEFYAISIDSSSGDCLLGEDYHFCKLAIMNGFKVWAAPWARLSHTGTYTHGGTS